MVASIGTRISSVVGSSPTSIGGESHARDGCSDRRHVDLRAGTGDPQGDAARRRGRVDVDPLALADERGLVEHDRCRVAIVDRQLDLRDAPLPVDRVGLAQGQMVDRFAHVEHDRLVEHRAPIGDGPARGRVTVDCHDGTVFGQVGERFAVGAGGGGDRPVLDRDRLGVGIVVGEHGQPLVAALVAQHAHIVARLGVAGHVLRAAPVVRSVTVRVGDDHPRRVRDRIAEPVSAGPVISGRVTAERGAVQDQFRTVDHARAGGVDEPVAAAGQHDHVVLRPDRRHRCVDADQRHRGERFTDAGVTDRLFVDDRNDADVRCRLAEPLGREQVGARGTGAGEQVVDDLGPGEAEAVERHVVGHPDRVDAEQAGNRCDRVDVDHTVLEAVVQGEHEVHRRRAAERQQVAGQ